ncbi:MAG TPA: alpha/beta hydrolase [Thermoleophilaceae bacterium]|nr:alpha/beta hydrolase [Thermoleophilaceae bacterium]
MDNKDLRRRLLAGLPVTERRLDVAGVSTTVLEGGDGPPLVLLHGGIESGGVYWARVVSRLAESHALVVPDVPGLGESEPVDRLDHEVFAGWFTALLRETCREKPTLIAHSLLGSLAGRFATRHGDVLHRLVIYGSPGIGPYRLPLGLIVALIRSDLRPTERNLERFMSWPFLDPERLVGEDPEWFEAFAAHMVSCGSVAHVKRTMRGLLRAGIKQVPEGELERIPVPTALVWGRHDRMVPLRVCEWTSARLGWPMHVIEGAGHVPHVEQPEAFVRVLHAVMEGSAARVDSPRARV